jgi:hypothetical protein
LKPVHPGTDYGLVTHLRRRLVPLFLVAGLGRLPVREPGAAILDPQAQLARWSWWDNRDWDWYAARIPFFESPERAIDATYYYRWELVTKHLTYGSPQTGYTFSEFINRPHWSGAYGSISCPLGHQFYEVRWLKDRRVIEDFTRYWFETPGAQPRSYSNWYGDATWATYLVLGDTGFLRRRLPSMKAQYRGWVAEHWDSAHAMFRWDGMHDGMETNINSRQTADPFAGAEGYRPTLNSYLYGDEMAIARASAVLGDSTASRVFAERAAVLKQRVQQELWDPTRHFFFAQFAHDEQGGIEAGSLTYQTGPFAGNPHGREEIGFVPWQFNLPDSGYEAAWQYLMDTAYFFAPFGPTTVERHDPQFFISPICCEWSGNSWPYATTQTLVALANLLNNYHQSSVTKADYVRLLRVYSRTQRLDGRPYIAEAANPDNGSWDGHNAFHHSEHYFHSGYVDLIITGLVGLRPRADSLLEVNPLAPDDWPYFALDGVAYHGHRVSIIWDRDGTRYHRGAGLTLLVDGRAIATSPRLGRLVAPLGPAAPAAPAATWDSTWRNLAVNNERAYYPRVTASSSTPAYPPFYLNDGNYWYHVSPPDRWTSAPGRDSDWVLLDFGVARPVETVKLYFLDDGTGVRPPARYAVQAWTPSGWTDIPDQRRAPAQPEGHRPNVVSFTPIATPRLRFVLVPQAGSATGLTEIEAWAHTGVPLAESTAPVPDLAYGARASASFTSRWDSVSEVNDGYIDFTVQSRNRWTAYGSPNRSDWVEIDFPAPRTVRAVDLYLWGDGGGVKAPRRYTIEAWDETASRWEAAHVWSQVPARPRASALNTVRITPVRTEKLRVVFEHDLPAFSGLTELMIWDTSP